MCEYCEVYLYDREVTRPLLSNDNGDIRIIKMDGCTVIRQPYFHPFDEIFISFCPICGDPI